MLTVTANATRTVAINPAFLQEIKDDNRHLRDLRIGLRALIGNRLVLRARLKRLVTLLDEFRDQLALHFALEEAYGYFEDALDVDPRLSELTDELREQHRVLFSTLVEIVQDAEDAELNNFPSYQVGQILLRFRKLDADLDDHEAEEAKLIVEAMDRDIGGEG